jgi:integrase
MNGGNRSQKFFKTQLEAFRWIGSFTSALTLRTVKSRIKKGSSSEKVGGLVEIYLASLEAEGLEKNGVAQAKVCLRRFTDHFGGMGIKDVTPDDIDAWIDTLNYAQRTIWNHFSCLRTFFSSTLVRRIIPVSPFDLIKAPAKNDADARKMILTPPQMRDLLKLEVDPWIKCKIVLGGFAGLRTCELARMSYDCIDPEFDEINVNKNHSKQGRAMRPRSITLQPAVMRHMPTGSGFLVGDSREWRCHRGMPVEAKLGFDRFPQNALRHSFASYHLSHFRDPSKTAFELGHASAKLIYETYANAVSRRDAAIWWDL